jgi:hypothetical protein
MALGPNSGYAATDLRGSAHWRLAVWGLRLAGSAFSLPSAVSSLVGGQQVLDSRFWPSA